MLKLLHRIFNEPVIKLTPKKPLEEMTPADLQEHLDDQQAVNDGIKALMKLLTMIVVLAVMIGGVIYCWLFP